MRSSATIGLFYRDLGTQWLTTRSLQEQDIRTFGGNPYRCPKKEGDAEAEPCLADLSGLEGDGDWECSGERGDEYTRGSVTPRRPPSPEVGEERGHRRAAPADQPPGRRRRAV